MRPLITAAAALTPSLRRMALGQARVAFHDAATAPATEALDLSLEAGKRSLETFKLFDLDGRIDDLNSDGRHESGNRQRVLSRYFDAYYKAENAALEGSLKPNATCFDNKLGIFCVKTEDYKAKGLAIIAMRGKRQAGRMFLAINGDYHLSILSSSKAAMERVGLPGVEPELLLAYMIKASLDASRYVPKLVSHTLTDDERDSGDEALTTRSDYTSLQEVMLTDEQKAEMLKKAVRKSCVGGYSHHLETLDLKYFDKRPKLHDVYERRYDQLVFDEVDRDDSQRFYFSPKQYFSFENLYNVADRRVQVEMFGKKEKPKSAPVVAEVETLKPAKPQIIELE